MTIVPMDGDHLNLVAALEESAGDAHWTREQFAKELQGEFRRFFVVVDDDSADILAYGGYWKAGPEAQITNLVVRPESRCQGIGRRLIEFMLDCARSEECTSCTLDVRAGNRHAQSLYKAIGFEVKGTRAKFYENPQDDAVLMEMTL